MKLASIFIQWAWIAHFDRQKYRAMDWQSLAEWSEGRRDALMSAAILARHKERESALAESKTP